MFYKKRRKKSLKTADRMTSAGQTVHLCISRSRRWKEQFLILRDVVQNSTPAVTQEQSAFSI